MPDENILEGLADNTYTALEIHLWAKAMRSAITVQEYIKVAQAQGMSKEAIKKQLLKDLNENGRMFGEFRNAIKATAKGNLMQLRDVGQYSELGVGMEYRWVSVLASNTCPDCEDRHGQTYTWDEWEAIGLPRAGATVCREHCQCILVPVHTEKIEPIRRQRKRK